MMQHRGIRFYVTQEEWEREEVRNMVLQQALG